MTTKRRAIGIDYNAGVINEPTVHEWTGEPTQDGDFRCYASSIEDKDAAIQTVKDLKADGQKAWAEWNPETGKYVVKTGR